jgi:hypothetical protein
MQRDFHFARRSGSKSMTTIGANYAEFRSCRSASQRVGNSLHRGMQRIACSEADTATTPAPAALETTTPAPAPQTSGPQKHSFNMMGTSSTSANGHE